MRELNRELAPLVAVPGPVPVPGSSSGAWVSLLVMCVNGEFVRFLFVRIGL